MPCFSEEGIEVMRLLLLLLLLRGLAYSSCGRPRFRDSLILPCCLPVVVGRWGVVGVRNAEMRRGMSMLLLRLAGDERRGSWCMTLIPTLPYPRTLPTTFLPPHTHVHRV